MKKTAIDYQIKIDLGSNLTRLKRRFVEANEAFAERFAINLNKHFDYYINEEITKLIKRLITKLLKYFNSYINYRISEKTTKSKVADINY